MENVSHHVNDPVRNQVHDRVRLPVWRQAWEHTPKHIMIQVQDQVLGPVQDQIRDRVYHPVRDQAYYNFNGGREPVPDQILLL